ncbi:MAG: iron-sulfur cluster assembly scaffold protein [Chlorobia bacterium]|nr:iron-sulfur cluster assembly scaffold protein [Fimbriimonadaceae bacterium]
MFSDLAKSSLSNVDLSGPLEKSNAYGSSGSPGGGPYLELWMLIDSGLVKNVSYRSNGCPAMMHTGATLARIAMGREAENLRSLTVEDVDRLVGGLPEGKGYCADMAIGALTMALDAHHRADDVKGGSIAHGGNPG